MMNLGNNQITEQFFGDTPIKSIWLGNTKVWAYTYDYEISNAHLVYSDGSDRLWCDATNYAYIECTLTKKKGTYVESSQTAIMNFTASLSEYLYVDEMGRISFNINDYGTTDMKYHSNPITLSLTPFLNGITNSYNLYLQVEPNLLSKHTSVGWNISGSTSYTTLNSSQSSCWLSFQCNEVFNNTYTSDRTTQVEESRTAWIINETTHEAIGSGTTSYIVPLSTNTNDYPILHQWRITPDSNPEQYLRDDFYYDIMQKSNVTRDTPLAVYWGVIPLQEDDIIGESTDFILLNDGHKDGLHYKFECNDAAITITEDRGIIYVNGVTSSTTATAIITVWEDVVPPEREWWEDEVEIVIEPTYHTIRFDIEGY